MQGTRYTRDYAAILARTLIDVIHFSALYLELKTQPEPSNGTSTQTQTHTDFPIKYYFFMA